MKKIYFVVFLLLLAIPCFAIGSEELIDKAGQFDGQTVIYEGEVVGDIMHRGDFVWLSVNDGGAALGVFCSKEDLPKIEFVGDYKHIGDTIQISGIFHKACAQHGGDLDIHAKKIEITKPGRVVIRKFDMGRLYRALILIPIALLLFFLRPHKEKEEL